MLKPKVLHLSYSDLGGGAAIGAYRLHNALLDIGIASEMLVIEKKTNDASVKRILKPQEVKLQKTYNRQSGELRNLAGIPDLSIRSFGIFGPKTADLINQSNCDVVHFHWIAGNTIRIRDIPTIRKPIVWKMPDMWPFSGAEHYIGHFDAKRYKYGYTERNAPEGMAVDIDRWVWELKRHYYKNADITVVSPSRFLAHGAHESVLFRDREVHVISNPLPKLFIDYRLPSPDDRRDIRRRHNLPADTFLCAFSAYSTTEPRKGYGHIEKGLREFLPRLFDRGKVTFTVIGDTTRRVEEINGYSVHFLPRITEPEKYFEVLGACDVLFFPSEMDSTAMVVQEALCAGVPTVAFDVGGMPEMVIHGRNGYLAKPYDVADLFDGLAWVFHHPDKDSLSKYARNRAVRMHDPDLCARSYQELYMRVTGRSPDQVRSGGGRLFDRIVTEEPPFEHRNLGSARVMILDPSVRHRADTSHNTDCCLSLSAVLHAEGVLPIWVVNEQCEFENPFGPAYKRFGYTAYDKIRTTLDRRDDYEMREPKRFPGRIYPGERDVYDILKDVNRVEKLGSDDAIYVPMADRYLVEGVLMWLDSVPESRRPKVLFLFMLENGDFLPGGYDIAGLLRKAMVCGKLSGNIAICVETELMAQKFKNAYGVDCVVAPPPTGFADSMLEKLLPEPQRSRYKDAYRTISSFFEGTEHDDAVPQKREGEWWVLAPGRGRNDKGYARLPGIIDALDKASDNKRGRVKFIMQEARAMDGLQDVVSNLSRRPNVHLLPSIISTPVLDLLFERADVILLPYDATVYKERGSAFVYKAIACGKPLVVTADTGLMTSITENIARSAATPDGFAAALHEIMTHGVEREQQLASARAYLESLDVVRTLTGISGTACRPNRKKVLLFTFGRRSRFITGLLTRNFLTTECRYLGKDDDRDVLAEEYANTELLMNYYVVQAEPTKGDFPMPVPIVDALRDSAYDYVFLLNGLSHSVCLMDQISRAKTADTEVCDLRTMLKREKIPLDADQWKMVSLLS